MIKFNKEEISLCKQAAEKYRKNLKIGMYVWRKFDKTIQLIYGLDEELKIIYTTIVKTGNYDKLYWNNLEGRWLIPLWTISDCLEFLKEKGFVGIQLLGSKSWVLWANQEQGGIYEILGDGKTPLEACLKAVLAVLEEGK